MPIRISSEAHPLLAVIEDRTWTDFARCRGRLDLFFEPHREQAAQRAVREQAAKQLCAECPVLERCREAGRRNHESGIWGGETEEERIAAGFPIRTVTRASLLAARAPVASTDDGTPATCDPEVA
jgi:WhiB family transcriptional regulator, redox-sensing transcriptional regulator